MTSLSDQRWAEFVACANESLARWGFQPRPVGIPVLTDALARALCARGLGSLVVYRAGQLDYGSHWAERPCDCTDGGRNQLLINCPECRGEGTVRA